MASYDSNVVSRRGEKEIFYKYVQRDHPAKVFVSIFSGVCNVRCTTRSPLVDLARITNKEYCFHSRIRTMRSKRIAAD
jgi:hypothetical protein